MRKGSLTADRRERTGKGEAGRTRRAGRIPGVVYGGGAAPFSVSVVERDLQSAIKTGVRILDLKVGGESMAALLRDVQYDHLGERVVHVDFQRLVAGAAVQIRVPLVYRGTPVGLKAQGVFNAVYDTLEVSCKPEDIPADFVLDISPLDIGSSLHVRDVKLPPGVTTLAAPDDVIAVVTHSDREVEAVQGVVPEEGAVQPEVIGEAERKAKEEAEAAGAATAGGGKKEKKKDEKKDEKKEEKKP